MPGKKHLPGATAKQQRQYEHIRDGELKRGRSAEEAKRIAASTVTAQMKKNKGKKSKRTASGSRKY